MKKWYLNLNSCSKTALLSSLVVVAVAILLIPLFFFNLYEIPLAILLGGFVNIIYYLIAGINQKRGGGRNVINFDIFLLIARFVLFAAIAILLAWLYYSLKIKVFNLFAYVGAYLFPILIYAIISRKEHK